MTRHTRRDFLKSSMAGAAAAAATVRGAVLAAGDPVLGLIFPPKDYPVPPEALRLYPTGVKFLSRGIGLERLTPDGYDAAIPEGDSRRRIARPRGRHGDLGDGHVAHLLQGAGVQRGPHRAREAGDRRAGDDDEHGHRRRPARREGEAHCGGDGLQRRGDRSAQGLPRGVRVRGAGREGARLRADSRRRRHHRQQRDGVQRRDLRGAPRAPTRCSSRAAASRRST